MIEIRHVLRHSDLIIAHKNWIFSKYDIIQFCCKNQTTSNSLCVFVLGKLRFFQASNKHLKLLIKLISTPGFSIGRMQFYHNLC